MTRTVFLFGDCSLDIAARDLRRDGEPVAVTPTVFDCIAYLVEHHDRAVGRDELVSAVWGKISVTDTTLGKVILAARRAVGDTAEAQAILRTIPRFGYHWVAEVRLGDPADSANRHGIGKDAGSSAPPSDPAERTESTAQHGFGPARSSLTSPSGKPRRWLAGAAASAAIAAVALVVVVTWRKDAPARHPSANDVARAPATVPASRIDAIAVLPVDVLADADDAWWRLGLMDLIASRLRAAGLAVLPSDSVVQLVPPGTSTDDAIAALRRVIDNDRLIVPAMRKAGPDWIVRAELLNADGSRRAVQALAGNPVAATDVLARRLLELLGKQPMADASPHEPTLTELLQRIDASRLADDLDQASAVIEAAPPSLRSLAEVQFRRVQIDLRAGRFDSAREGIARVLDSGIDIDPPMRARLLDSLCVARTRQGQLDEALSACDEAVVLLEQGREPDLLGRTYNDRGVIHARQGRHDAATADFSRARVALGLAGDPLQLARVDSNESTLEMVRGRHAEALPIQQRAARQFERFGMINELVISLSNQISANLALVQPAAALAASDQGWPYLDRVDDPVLLRIFKHQRAEALDASGRLAEARALLGELIDGDEVLGRSWPQVAIARASLAKLELADGNDASALALAERALPGLMSPEYAQSRAVAWLTAIRALQRLDRLDDADAQLVAFTAWAGEAGPSSATIQALIAAAEQAAARGHDADAQRQFDEAVTRAGEGATASALNEVANAYGAFLLAQGELGQAGVVIGKMARFAERDFGSAVMQARLYHALGQPDAWAAAMTRVRRLAGERPVPDAVASSPMDRVFVGGN